MFHTFSEIQNNSSLKRTIGKKAASLVEMLEWGLLVPEGGCITLKAWEYFFELNNLEDPVNHYLKSLTENNTVPDTNDVNRLTDLIMNGNLPVELCEEIDRYLANNQDKSFAVRSSGTCEDLPNASFAGQYTSVLNITSKNDLYNSIKKCWASVYSKRILEYCIHNKLDVKNLKMAVIIQEMIPAEKSGVVFTINPLKGYDCEMVIEACFGLGEGLVNGEVTPDRYFFDWYNRQENCRVVENKNTAVICDDQHSFTKSIQLSGEKCKEPVLSKAEVSELADLALKIQVNYGFPVDVEWAQYNHRFYILQSRPITKINYEGIDGEWTTANLRDGGVASTVCTPYMWTLYGYVLRATIPHYFKKIGLIDKHKDGDFVKMFYGRPYWNVFEVKEGFKKILGFVERDFDADLGIEVTYEGKGYTSDTNLLSIINGLRVLRRLKKSFQEQIRTCPSFRARQLKRLSELEKFDPETLSDKEFYTFYEKFIKEEYYFNESFYFYHFINNSNYQSLFKEMFEKKIKKICSDVDLLVLMSGINSDAHFTLNYRLWDISRLIREDTRAYDLWKNTPVEGLRARWLQGVTDDYLREASEIINQFKHHSTHELNVTIPRYGEDPWFIFENIKNYIELDETHNPRLITQKQQQAYISEKTKVLKALPFYQRRSFEKKLAEMRSFLWWRDELRYLSIWYYFYVRRFTFVLARDFVKKGFLDNIDDIFFMSTDDILSIIHGGIDTAEAGNLLERNKLYYNSFRNFINPNEIGNRFSLDSVNYRNKGKVLKGTPCCPGIITGKARVLTDIFDSGRLEKGDILVTKFTDPGWTPKFGLISGVVTECGGLLSHTAVISREYGIPSVLAVNNITKIIEDGSEITINGSSGEIYYT